MISTQKQTFRTSGERRVSETLRAIPPQKLFSCYEPRLIDHRGNSFKPDFVVVGPGYGVAIIEVKDWVNIVRATQDIISVKTRATGEIVNLTNPFDSMEEYSYALSDSFARYDELWTIHRGRKRLTFPWQPVLILPNIPQETVNKIADNGIWERRAVFGREIVDNPERFLEAFYNLPWRFTLKESINRTTLDLIRMTVDPSLELVNTEGELFGTITPEQELLVKLRVPVLEQTSFLEDEPNVSSTFVTRLIRGVAGSGKTLVLINRAQDIAERYEELNPRVLVITFNKDLADNLKQRIGIEDERVDVKTFHAVCRDILKNMWLSPINTQRWLEKNEWKAIEEAKLTAQVVADEFEYRKELPLFAQDGAQITFRPYSHRKLNDSQNMAVDAMFERYQQALAVARRQSKPWFDWADVPHLALKQLELGNYDKKYHCVLIDEGQDFAPSWIAVIKQLIVDRGNLFIADDPKQSIFRHYTWKQKGLTVIGRITTKLTVPFRSTLEISTAAHAIAPAEAAIIDEVKTPPNFKTYELINGKRPLLAQCSNSRVQVEYVTEQVSRLIDQKVNPRQIAILYPVETRLPDLARLSERGCYTAHFLKMKGMEFSYVFVLDIQNTLTNTDDAEVINGDRRKLFTAMTRARKELSMFCVGPIPAALSQLTDHVDLIKIN